MTDDPRICRVAPPDFNHLSMAEVEEERRLWLLLTRGAGLDAKDDKRLAELSRRRHRPQYDPARRGAA